MLVRSQRRPQLRSAVADKHRSTGQPPPVPTSANILIRTSLGRGTWARRGPANSEKARNAGQSTTSVASKFANNVTTWAVNSSVRKANDTLPVRNVRVQDPVLSYGCALASDFP